MTGRPIRRLALALLPLLLGACAGASGQQARSVGAGVDVVPTTVAEAPPPTPPPAPPETVAPPVVEQPTTTAAPLRGPRVVYEQAWTPFAVVENVVLHHPSERVERVGFHESNHDGARELQPLPSTAAPMTLETRERGTGPHTAADIVAHPAVEVRAPVTGRVLRSGTYVLYCDYRDDFAVIEPDGRPGWEVKVLHIDGVAVRRGDRVVAGETVLASRPTQLPFESQVDETTAQPAWPHIHIEVVDPSIPDRPSPGGGC